MQQWEYLVLMHQIGATGGTCGVDGKEYKTWDRKSSTSIIRAELGREGWELVAISPLSSPSNTEYIFKRPKP